MNLSEFKLMKRKNLGNYEHIEAQATISLVEGEKEEDAVAMANKVVDMGLGAKPASKTVQTKTSTNAKPAKEEEVKEEEKKPQTATTKKATTKKATTKKASTTKKQPTQKEVLEALRKYAEKKESREMAVAVMKDVTGKESLKDVDKKDYTKLVKALAV